MRSIIFTFLILLGMTLITTTYAADQPLPKPVGRVVWVKGTFKASMANNEVRLLQKDSIIYLHDTLITDEKSQAQIGFTDNSLMTFQPSTKLFINEYVYKPKAKASAGKYILNLIEGGFRTITGLIAKKTPDNYAINTPVATIGVRGTDYRAYYHNGRFGLGWYKGKPCVTAIKDRKTICLSKDLQYAEVPDANSAAVPLQQRPDYFDQDLMIKVVTIDGFDGGNRNSNNFCISY